MDTKQIARGIVDGISSVPGLMHHGMIRTWQGSGLAGGDIRGRNQRETERFLRLIRAAGSKEQPIRRLITLVMTDFYQKLNDAGKEAINNQLAYGAGHLTGKTGTQFGLAYIVGSLMIRKAASAVVYREFVRFSAP